MGMIDTQKYRVEPGGKLHLSQRVTSDDGGLQRANAEAALSRASEQLVLDQNRLYAQRKHALLVIFQGMDTAGKDSTIRHVFAPLNPQGCHVTSFKVPSEEEAAHDFLWRVHAHTPARGMIAIFNRSHYEGVLIERVRKLKPKSVWALRYRQINDFERLLHDQGTIVLKFFLHISKEYQKEQLLQRIDNPDKRWKFNPGDLVEHQHWDDYMAAYDDALSRCSTAHAPWYVIPAETKWFRNLLVAEVVREALESLDLAFPMPDFNPAQLNFE